MGIRLVLCRLVRGSARTGTNLTIASVTTPVPRVAAASSVLSAAAVFWWLVAILGQWTFLYYIVVLYGTSTLTGNFQAWSKNSFLFKGYVAGDTAGNLAFAGHVLLAGYLSFGGAIQLVPQIRSRVPRFHRWNGLVFVVAALAVSLSGLYMVWIRHSNPTPVGSLATSLNGVLIIAFAVFALRAALARDFVNHRRWALRLFIAASGQWFIRVGVFAWVIVNSGTGLKPHMGPFIQFWNFGCYLVPLAILELYLRAKDGGNYRFRYAMAGGLVSLTLLMAVGILGGSVFLWKAILVKV